MKIELSKEWFHRMALLEGNSAIGAGPIARDPRPNSFQESTRSSPDETNIVFGRFIRLMRREKGLTIEKLAERADIELSELVSIEDDTTHRPEPRTVYQLANFFHIKQSRLSQVAGLTTKKDPNLINESVRFAARSDPTAKLTPEERAALEEFVKVLGERE